ncbi:hypothetical protein FKM82_007150 [Ascaphus truei]
MDSLLVKRHFILITQISSIRLGKELEFPPQWSTKRSRITKPVPLKILSLLNQELSRDAVIMLTWAMKVKQVALAVQPQKERRWISLKLLRYTEDRRLGRRLRTAFPTEQICTLEKTIKRHR